MFISLANNHSRTRPSLTICKEGTRKKKKKCAAFWVIFYVWFSVNLNIKLYGFLYNGPSFLELAVRFNKQIFCLWLKYRARIDTLTGYKYLTVYGRHKHKVKNLFFKIRYSKIYFEDFLWSFINFVYTVTITVWKYPAFGQKASLW